jgi:hypothetical protein
VGAGCFSADDVVSLDDRRHSDVLCAIVLPPVNANHASLRPDKNLRASCNFGGKCEGNVQLRSGLKILVQRKVNSTRGDVSGSSITRAIGFLDWNFYDYVQ